jgi:hypothetical protein
MKYLDALPWAGKYIFQGAHGQHWTEGTARKAWWELMAHLRIGTDCPRHCQKQESSLRTPPCLCLQLLDVRRTLASYLYRLHRRQEVDDLTIKALLNHYDGRPVAIYTRLDVEYPREDPARLCRLALESTKHNPRARRPQRPIA